MNIYLAWDLEEVTNAFLEQCDPYIEKLNHFSERLDGFYRIEIVPEMYDNEKVALAFNRKFLNFLQKLKKLEDIDIDQYVYW